MNDTKEMTPEFWAGLLSPIFLVAFILPFILLNAYVLSCLWAWYVVPLFHVPPLTLPYAFGISLMTHFLVNRPPPENKQRSASLLVFHLANPFFVLVLGWLGSLFL